eukprot:3868304-Amphidinium_carterae.1
MNQFQILKFKTVDIGFGRFVAEFSRVAFACGCGVGSRGGPRDAGEDERGLALVARPDGLLIQTLKCNRSS